MPRVRERVKKKKNQTEAIGSSEQLASANASLELLTEAACEDAGAQCDNDNLNLTRRHTSDTY